MLKLKFQIILFGNSEKPPGEALTSISNDGSKHCSAVWLGCFLSGIFFPSSFFVCLAFLFHLLKIIIYYPADLQTLEPSENAGEKLQVLEGIDKKLRQGGPFFVFEWYFNE